MAAKYKVGNNVVIVRLNKRTPQYIRDAIRTRRKRTVVGVFYDDKTQHTRYYLGGNRIGNDALSNYSFRAEELSHFKHNKQGRLREKRIYRRMVV